MTLDYVNNANQEQGWRINPGDFVVVHEQEAHGSFGIDEMKTVRVAAGGHTMLLFRCTGHNDSMVLLKRTVKIGQSGEPQIKVAPFGGALQMVLPERIFEITEGFNFDSPHSQEAQRLRIFTSPAGWWRLRKEMQQWSYLTDLYEGILRPFRTVDQELSALLGAAVLKDEISLSWSGVHLHRDPVFSKQAGCHQASATFMHEGCIKSSQLREAVLKHCDRQPVEFCVKQALGSPFGTHTSLVAMSLRYLHDRVTKRSYKRQVLTFSPVLAVMLGHVDQ